MLAPQPTAHWVKVLDDAGVPCGPVYSYEQLFADPQVVHRELVVHADDPELGRVPHIRTPIRMSASRVAVREVAPRLGQHTDEILAAPRLLRGGHRRSPPRDGRVGLGPAVEVRAGPAELLHS